MPKAKLPVNFQYFTRKEIFDRLKAYDNTAPGPDGLKYNHLKLVDLDAVVLTPLYNVCVKFKAVPSSWKKLLQSLSTKKGLSKIPGSGARLLSGTQFINYSPAALVNDCING